MVSSKYWYSPIYQEHNYGFFVQKKGSNQFLGFKYKNGKEVLINLDHESFRVLKKEWK